ncbi:MAG: acylphosphatase [Candidatus Aenigmarchaeota archaeon]|nr:acylphosphatase [Candidatus Aenigmarchaeota archaeon]
MILSRARIFVFGKVQGVGFRFSAKIKAKSLGLNGWVRNVQNHVEVLVEGERKSIEQIVEWCKVGPSTAKVDDIKVDYHDYRGEFESFEIR